MNGTVGDPPKAFLKVSGWVAFSSAGVAGKIRMSSVGFFPPAVSVVVDDRIPRIFGRARMIPVAPGQQAAKVFAVLREESQGLSEVGNMPLKCRSVLHLQLYGLAA